MNKSFENIIYNYCEDTKIFDDKLSFFEDYIQYIPKLDFDDTEIDSFTEWEREQFYYFIEDFSYRNFDNFFIPARDIDELFDSYIGFVFDTNFILASKNL